MKPSLTLCLWLGLAGLLPAASPVLRVLRDLPPGLNRLANPGFEGTNAGRPTAWGAAPQGLRLEDRAGRAGTRALACTVTNSRHWQGASQTISLQQTQAVPILVRGWSRAEEVSGSPDSGYALYVDLTYQDGTPLWGQVVPFRCGTHDWERRELTLLPSQPVKSLTLHCLLRQHTGRAWFDDLAVEELTAGEVLRFQGTPVSVVPVPRSPARVLPSQQVAGPLKLTLVEDRITALEVSGRALGVGRQGGFMARDVAANSDVFAFQAGACPDLGLALEHRLQPVALPGGGGFRVEGTITDTRRRDRAITLYFALPVDATGWQWGDDIQRGRPITGQQEYFNGVSMGSGATGTLSQYPLAAIHDHTVGLALGLDMARPAQYRLVYHAGTRQLLIAYDLGLVPEANSRAEFAFVFFTFPPAWGFRAAWAEYMDLFPDHFQVRVKEQGLWMPFTDVSRVQGAEDFQFKFHEGNNNVPFDDTWGILSFRYTEPMTWWMKMDKSMPRTHAAAVAERNRLAAGPRNSDQRMAAATLTAAMLDEAGQPALSFRDTPWCNGAVWSLNPNPRLPASNGLNGATVHWNDTLKEQLYGPGAKGTLDGEYLDSLEGYVTTDLNFNREHFKHTTVPLTFATETGQPALHKGLAVAEFTRWFCDDVHRLGKLTFANSVPHRFTFLCPWLDILGTETDWVRQGRYHPPPDAQLCLWRTLSGQKPYLLLMNTDYDVFTPPLVEQYFQRSLALGFWPGMFSHNAADNPYWQNPKWYNRDRPLFKQYLPLIKRVTEAGWQPVTAARADVPELALERFGPGPDSMGYLTLWNPAMHEITARIRTEAPLPHGSARELITQKAVPRKPGGLEVTVPAQSVRLLELRGS
jgi:hypothetical protein